MKKDIDWENLGFSYISADYRYSAYYKNGSWNDGELITDNIIKMNECACVLQYAQTCFEGLKAYTTVDNRIVCFRPDLNAQRMAQSCNQLKMPVYPEDKFIDAVKQVAKANADFVPPYGYGASLYIRPYMYGADAIIGVKPANEFEFRIISTPVGAYFKAGAEAISLRVPDFDRAAPRGTGHVKAGLNYAMSLYAIVDAHEKGYNENLYLDSATRTNVEETGGANIIFITKDNKFVTPKSSSILNSITRRSLMYVAEHYLGLEVEQRVIPFEEIKEFKEAALCGTAAVLSPVGRIINKDVEIKYEYKDGIGEITKKLYDTLVGIQLGKIEAPENWIVEIK